MILTLRRIMDLMNDYTERFGGNLRGVPEPRDQGQQLDMAMKMIARRYRKFEPMVEWYVQEGNTTYYLDDPQHFSRRILEPRCAWVGGVRSSFSGEMSLPNSSEIAEAYPNFPVDPTVLPRRTVFWDGTHEIKLLPSPISSDIEGGYSRMSAYIIPGWRLSAGGYHLAAPIGDDFGASGGSSATETTSTIASTAFTWTGSGTPAPNTGTQKAATEAQDSDYFTWGVAISTGIVADPGGDIRHIDLTTFDLSAIGSSDTITDVALKAFRAYVDYDTNIYTSAPTLTLELYGGSYASPTFGPYSVELTVSGDAAMTSYSGALPSLGALTKADLATLNARITLSVADQPEVGAGSSSTQTIRLDVLTLEVDHSTPASGLVSLETASVPGGSSLTATDWEAVPDLPVALHEPLAILAAYIAASPMASDQEAINAMGQVAPMAFKAFEDYSNENNERARVSRSRPQRFGLTHRRDRW